jgi:hypothetical protein
MRSLPCIYAMLTMLSCSAYCHVYYHAVSTAMLYFLAVILSRCLGCWLRESNIISMRREYPSGGFLLAFCRQGVDPFCRLLIGRALRRGVARTRRQYGCLAVIRVLLSWVTPLLYFVLDLYCRRYSFRHVVFCWPRASCIYICTPSVGFIFRLCVLYFFQYLWGFILFPMLHFCVTLRFSTYTHYFTVVTYYSICFRLYLIQLPWELDQLLITLFSC